MASSRKAHNHRRSARGTVEVLILPQRLNAAVSEYFAVQPPPTGAGPWVRAPEIPTSEEVTRLQAYDQQSGQETQIAFNQTQGPWLSMNTYLEAHYNFLREEAVRPLREAVLQLKVTPSADEESFSGTIGIYEQIHIIGLVTSTRGIAMRITFSTKRSGKQIRWQQANRLLTGTLVALTPSHDMFRAKTIVATVAARELQGLQLNPPELELFFARATELELDPVVEWTMIEARSSFFEAERHTMLALQKLMHEPPAAADRRTTNAVHTLTEQGIPIIKHLVNTDNDIDPPAYVVNAPVFDLGAIGSENNNLKPVNVLTAWPDLINSTLDESQLAALRRILTKALAIVQGPPGTGKTFVSVKALQLMLVNRNEGDPPIIVTAQTNHALDQLLRHVAQFEPEFVRLGGRSKDREVIAERTLHTLRSNAEQCSLPGCKAPGARKDMHRIEKEIGILLEPLQNKQHPLDHHILRKHHLLNEAQAKTLEDGANKWVQASLTSPAEARSPFTVWLADALIKVPYKPQFEEFGFEFEEAEVEYEQLKDIEAENAVKEEEFIDALHGSVFTLADNFTCSKLNTINDAAVERLLQKEQDLWKIPEASRTSVYLYLQKRLKAALLAILTAKAREYDAAARQARIGNWERDELILREQKVIGVTTTGLSKYRGLLASLGCKIVLVEEAAETLEAPVIAACMPTLEHLILVGDHQQLRPHCKVKEHERKPYNYNISMFERLVKNSMGMAALAKQRRMIPEIRRILRPIYRDLIQDHESVKDPVNRPDVPGMGGINSYFFTHHWPERRDNMMSCINIEEVNMIVGLVGHLVHNGMYSKEITILTFYNGQRKQLIHALKSSTALEGLPFRVVTVDSYQGEENKVVILSLVRSNENKAIGFLSIDNRICVALSRAQCGLYIFGNAMLFQQYKTWNKVISIMVGLDSNHGEEIPKLKPQRFHEFLPVHCNKHDRTVDIKEPSDWEKLSGGCEQRCEETLRCGHCCPLACHPFSHDRVSCSKPCGKSLSCGHKCDLECSEKCICKMCAKPGRQKHKPGNAGHALNAQDESSGTSSSARTWQVFAKHEPIRYGQAIVAASSSDDPNGRATQALPALPVRESSPLKQEMLLIDFED